MVIKNTKGGKEDDMEKAITTMRGWYIEKDSGGYNLCGEAENHPELGRNVYRDDEDVKRIAELVEAGKIEMKEAVRKENERLIEIAKQYEDSVYLEVYSISQGGKMAYNLEGCTGTVNPLVHQGRFQDSILYRGYIYEKDLFFDFRYFPDKKSNLVMPDSGHLPQGFDGSIETYTWSDNIKYAVIKNMRKGNISFNNEQIAPGETKVFRNPS
jgi:hypothetical protein